MCKQHALRIAWTIARSIAFSDFRVLRWKFTYDWKCVNTTYCVPLFMPTACFPEGPSPPFTFCSFWRRRQWLKAVFIRTHTYIYIAVGGIWFTLSEQRVHRWQALGCRCSVLSNYNAIICFPYVMTWSWDWNLLVFACWITYCSNLLMSERHFLKGGNMS